jgi:RNA polymerase sigma-70 factor (ECF subfamily)
MLAAVAERRSSSEGERSPMLGSRFVDTGSKLLNAFVAHVRCRVDHGGDIEPLLAAKIEQARRSWPTCEIAPETFAAYLGEHLPADEDVRESLLRVHADDLYLACGLVRGDRPALEAFERTLPERVARFVCHLDSSPPFLDEVTQAVRIKLLAPLDGESVPKIGNYSGRNSLESWLCTVAIRTALDLRRGRKDEPIDELSDVLAATDDPELELLRAKHEELCREALREAHESLSIKQRRMLRLYYRERFTYEQLGSLYHVNPTTARTWVLEARGAVIDAVRGGLKRRLRLDNRELENLLQLMQSRLDISLGQLWLTEQTTD